MGITGLKLKAAIRRQNAWVADSWEARNDIWEAYAHQAHLERKAIAAARKAAEPKRNHCQVCGAAILDNTGVIAHHGYTRPGYGWQTASCMGARFVAYEESCERLKEVCAMLERFVVDTAATRAQLDTDPPSSLTYQKAVRGYGRHTQYEAVTVERPADYNGRDDFRSGSYAHQLAIRKMDLDSQVRHAAMDVKIMNERITNWVKVK